MCEESLIAFKEWNAAKFLHRHELFSGCMLAGMDRAVAESDRRMNCVAKPGLRRMAQVSRISMAIAQSDTAFTVSAAKM